jgi:2-aminoadipate transaminase
LNWKFSKRAKKAKASEIRELLKVSGTEGWISFAGGYPDPKLIPKERMAEIAEDVILNLGKDALQYGPTEGILPLRETILQMEKESGVNGLEIDNIIITTGSQQGLELLAKIFINPGEKVVVEAPSYLGAVQAFSFFEANFVSVPLDEKGIKTDILREKLKENKEAKFIYLVPTFHNPAGVTLSLERRKEVIELAEEYQIPVIEDDPYSKIRFEGEDLPSLLSMDGAKNVIKLGTFSKIISGGFRLGWMVADKEVIRKAVLAKQSSDLCSPNLTQYLANEFIRRGLMKEYLEVVKREYKKKRDVMLSGLERYCSQKAEWTKPEGGLFVWVKTNVDTDKLFEKAKEKKIAYVPGSAFYPYREDKNHMRLNFSLPSCQEIEEGTKRLGEILAVA